MAGDDPCCRKRPAACCGKPFDNAAAHTPRGGTVTLTVAKENNSFILRVTDTGPGFTPEALAKAGEMLYTDAARSDASHQGIGAVFCEKVAQFHGGTNWFYL